MALLVNVAVLAVLLLGTIGFLTKGKYWGTSSAEAKASKAKAKAAEASARDIIAIAASSQKNCVIFFGSQTGNAEGFANRLAEEGQKRFVGLNTMVADLESYDYDNLDAFPADHLAIFIVATYGEGEPTDNALAFYEKITSADVTFSKALTPPLANLTYSIFGLGNKTYEFYNGMVRKVNATLESLGAQRIGTAGEGDDAEEGLDVGYLEWKEPMWAAVKAKMGLEEREGVEPDMATGITEKKEPAEKSLE